jgi:hypothetical protein
MAKKGEKKKLKIEALYTSVEVRGDNLVIRLEDGLFTTETEVVIDFMGAEAVDELAEAVERLQKCYRDEEALEDEDQDEERD